MGRYFEQLEEHKQKEPMNSIKRGKMGEVKVQTDWSTSSSSNLRYTLACFGCELKTLNMNI